MLFRKHDHCDEKNLEVPQELGTPQADHFERQRILENNTLETAKHCEAIHSPRKDGISQSQHSDAHLEESSQGVCDLVFQILVLPDGYGSTTYPSRIVWYS